MKNEYRYIYGVIGEKRERSFGRIGIVNHEEVYLIGFNDISAVVSNSCVNSFDSNKKDVLLNNLLTHQAIIEKVMKDYSIIPVKFAAFVNDEIEVKEFLCKGYSEFKKILEEIKDKIEFDVVVIFNRDKIFSHILNENEEIQRLQREISTKPEDITSSEKIELGKKVQLSLYERRKKYEKEILSYLSEEVINYRPHDVLNDMMVMNVSFLIFKRKEEKFDQKINKLDEKYNQLMNFRCIGPLPPYSFRTIEVKKLNFEEFNKAREILGLGEEISIPIIKEAYRKLIQKYHPDKFPGDTLVKKEFEKITKAYEELLDYFTEGKFSFKERGGKDFIQIKVLKEAK